MWASILFTGEQTLNWSYLLPLIENKKKRSYASNFIQWEYLTHVYRHIDNVMAEVDKWMRENDY